MMALSMWQPWGSLWLSDNKAHETRPRKMNYRGWLAVHSAKRPPYASGELPENLEEICNKTFGENWDSRLPLGAVIGAVYVIDCQSTNGWKLDGSNLPKPGSNDWICGNYDVNRYAIRRTEYFHIDPMPAIGRQGLFRLPEDINAKLVNEIVSRKLIGFAEVV